MEEPIIVELPDGSEAEFPAGTPMATIKSALQKRFPTQVAAPPAPPSEPSVSMGEYMTGPQDPGATRMAMEGFGQVAGGALGTAVAPGPGTIAGETGGYAVGSKGADFVLGEDTGSWKKKLGEGALLSMVPMGIGKAVSKLGRGAVRSALKIPPTQVGREGAEKVVDTLIKENIRVGEGGVAKSKAIIKSMESEMNTALRGSGSHIPVDDVTSVIEAQRPRFANTDDPFSAYDILDGVAEKLRNHPNVVVGKDGISRIPIEKAQLMKKELYKKLDNFYHNLSRLEPAKAEAGNVASIAYASEAEGLRRSILADPSIPTEAASWLKREGNVLNALRWVKRRANVAANMDPITFNDVLLGGLVKHGVPASIAVRILRAPAILSQIGIYGARHGKVAGKALRSTITAASPTLLGP